MSVNRKHSMGEYDTALICVAAVNMLMHSAPGTQTKEAMKCARFKQVDIKYDTYRRHIERLKKKKVASKSYHIVFRDGSIVASHPSQIVVRDGSTSSPSIPTISSRETIIVGSPPSKVVTLVIPITAITKASSVDIETTTTIPRDTIICKTSRRLQHHNAYKRNLKKRVDVAFITATRRWREEKTKDKNERKTTHYIVDDINIVHGTSLNDRTVRLYANRGDIDVPITGRGKKPILHESVELSMGNRRS